MKINNVMQLINRIEEDFKFEGGSVDFIGEFRTKVAELQEVHYSEDGKSTFVQSPGFGVSAAGMMILPMAQIMHMQGGELNPNPEEILGPQTEAAFEKFRAWLDDEGKL